MHELPENVAERLMAYLDSEMSAEEAAEFERLLQEHPEWRTEIAGMDEIVKAAGKLAFRPPPAEVWDGYWEEIHTRLGNRFGWIFLAVGGLILTVVGIYKAMIWAENFWVKGAIALIVAGFLTLFLSVLRGHLLERPHDRYRRIRR
jgi:ferric-dicitrate binding protein FerR (iron transport regulator)